jgi:hypothetical protein
VNDARAISRQWDECARAFQFPMLDNGYTYLAAARLSAFADADRWAMVVEYFHYFNRLRGTDGLLSCLYCFGNCLNRRPGTANEDFLYRVGDGPDAPLFLEESDDPAHANNAEPVLNPACRSVRIRGAVVPLDPSPENFATRGVSLAHPPHPTAPDLLRLLVLDHREALLSTPEELSQRVPADLPLLLTLDEWNHPDLANDEMPSRSLTFRQLAKVLATADPTHYRPTRPPNTHWSHWPVGGTL